jgi:hypothetical protein
MRLMAMSLKLNSVIRVAKVITGDAERGAGVVGPQRAALSGSTGTTLSMTRGPAGLSFR